jgi:Cu(I)/Ag(I) efflux system periplasmic protein CusF
LALEIIMNKWIVVLAVTLCSLAGAVQAQTSNGEVIKIDKAGARLTLKHAGIKNLDMPPMTMAFRAREPKMLDSVAVGDKVRFTAEKVDGNFTVTSLSK